MSALAGAMRLRLATAMGCTLALLAGCAGFSPPSPVTPTQGSRSVRATGENDGRTLSGRMSVRVDDPAAKGSRDVTAAFELIGDARRGELSLSTPLGSMMARAQWAPGSVSLTTPRGNSSHTDLGALTREVLGEELPVAAMFHWLRGRPSPDNDSEALAEPATGFRQLGWNIDLARFDDALVTARRERPPQVTVRVKLDRP